MIVRFMPSGRSFKWLGQYLVHDPKAQTTDRVGWTHTLNLANDDVPAAIHEMLATYYSRDLLKAEAGIRRGGAKLEKPVKHVSLNWHPSENLTREYMIAATQGFLRAMGWQDHQCVLVAHTDKDHRHVHLMLNAVHPTRGTRLDDGFEKRRAQAWALAYEQERGQVFCEERLKPAPERSQSPPRQVWEQLRDMPEPEAVATDADDDVGPGYSRQWGWKAQEWRQIKKLQKVERVVFFAGGKRAYRDARNEVYRNVRASFRKEWAAFYGLKRSGAASEILADVRADLIARQGAMLDERCTVAAADLRKSRDAEYRALLERQQEDRAKLVDRQERGLRSPHLWAARNVAATARTAGTGITGRLDTGQPSQGRAYVASNTGYLWTDNAGMVAQQRSAMRWLERAVDRVSRAPARHGSEPPDWLTTARARSAERQHAKSSGKESKSGAEMDVGLDP